jgi:hypothetical protein
MLMVGCIGAEAVPQSANLLEALSCNGEEVHMSHG